MENGARRKYFSSRPRTQLSEAASEALSAIFVKLGVPYHEFGDGTAAMESGSGVRVAIFIMRHDEDEAPDDDGMVSEDVGAAFGGFSSSLLYSSCFYSCSSIIHYLPSVAPPLFHDCHWIARPA